MRRPLAGVCLAHVLSISSAFTTPPCTLRPPSSLSPLPAPHHAARSRALTAPSNAKDMEGYTTQRGSFEPQVLVSPQAPPSTSRAPWPTYYCSPLQRSHKAPGEAPPGATARYVLVHQGMNLVRDADGGVVEAVFLPEEGLPEGLLADSSSVVAGLGYDEETNSCFYLLDVSQLEEPPTVAANERFAQLRSVGGLLSNDLDAGILSTARGLGVWHRTELFCSKCGSSDVAPGKTGSERKCGGCGKTHYPRIDPSVIVLITSRDGERALLGRKAGWPEGQYSTLAGFAEIGESLEETVVREVGEESGVSVDRESIRYVTSQPWLYPRSLMLAFVGTCEEGKDAIRIQEEEMEDVQWFPREEVRRALAGEAQGSPLTRLPGRAAVARSLISTWVEGKQ